MADLTYAKPEIIPLRGHATLNERWVQERIAEDPGLLGLGDLILKDKERMQARAGRLDLLLQDVELTRRYEVEIQLGKTDESHIIRTIEYWDYERKRYPQYEHTAVIVAEEITGRFLNVIALFNGFIPLIAIRMQAVKIGSHLSLVFSTVLDEVRLGLVDEDEGVQEPTDRAYWEKSAGKNTVAMADDLLAMIKSIYAGFTLRYNKHYIGLAKGGRALNFTTFLPRKDWLLVEMRMDQSEEIQRRLDEAGLDLMKYNSRWNSYRIRLTKNDLEKHRTLLQELLQKSFEEFGR